MEAAHSSSYSSKVIVNCYDPNSLFDKILPKLGTRLPLTKLHWKSPNRPLRSIDQLDVSFLRDESKADSIANTRRHQIPGLRQTPFVKIYLLRCDDKEVYKETCRKEVKQWLKTQGVSQDGKTLSKGQERHDAFEYIILHVVLPGTAAATQPKSSKHISVEASESTDSLNSKSKWTGKSSSTIFDKLKADFSSSSKAPFERVAQVRITDPENRQPNGISPSDIEEQWQDLTEKLKVAILQSFDARVAQYEDDIRDRENQRQLPGWNFCTFFVLKEGLARGFGNVGLLEDALAVYGELDAGLDTLLQDQAVSKESDPTGALLPFSNDLKPAIRSVLDSLNSDHSVELSVTGNQYLRAAIDLEKDNLPFDDEKHGYQQRILTNQVSALDLRIYIFTRQTQLMFRQARTAFYSSQSKVSMASLTRIPYDLNFLADICEKATDFINFATRVLRQDLYRAWGGQEGLSQEELKTQRLVIGEIVASWRWAAVIQMLADCRIPFLLDQQSTDLSGNGDEISNGQARSVPQVNGHATIQNQMLALWTAELLIMARDTLQNLVPAQNRQSLPNDDEYPVLGAWKFRSKSLNAILKSDVVAAGLLNELTTYAFWCFASANQTNSSRSMLYTLSKSEFENTNVDMAVWWLQHIPGLSNLDARTATDRQLLVLYGKCLKAQEKFEAYAQTLVTTLLWSVERPIARALPQHHDGSQYLLDELINVSENVSQFELPLSGLVTIKSVSRSISHEGLSDGFMLSLTLALRFDATVEISNVSLTLTSLEELDPTEILLTNRSVIALGTDATLISLRSNINTRGWYNIGRLTVTIGKLVLNHFFKPAIVSDENSEPFDQFKPDPVLVYPHAQALSVTAGSSTMVDLTQSGRLMFKVFSQENSIEECFLRIRPATAGFRLDLQAAQIKEEGQWKPCRIIDRSDANELNVGQVLSRSTKIVEVPFSTETQMTASSVKVECKYKIEDEYFNVFFTNSIFINLPININVQDIFQPTKTFSRFSAVPSTLHPLRLLKWSIENNSLSFVRSSSLAMEPLDIFAKMPAAWMVEIVHHESNDQAREKLGLAVEYQTYDDIILTQVENQFRADIQDSPAAFAIRLLLPHLIAKISTNWTEQDLETTVLLQTFEMMSFEQMKWNEITRALDKAVKISIDTWLRSWHSRRQWLDLTARDAPRRVVKISVDVPKPSMIISTNLTLVDSHAKHLVLGQPTIATVLIEQSQPNFGIEIFYEVASQSDTWLVGGKKRGTITDAQERTVTSILLVAQKPGHLLLPTINVQCRRKLSEESENVNFEVEHRSRAKSVLVIPNVHSTTIALGIEHTSSQFLTLDNRPRSIAR